MCAHGGRIPAPPPFPPARSAGEQRAVGAPPPSGGRMAGVLRKVLCGLKQLERYRVGVVGVVGEGGSRALLCRRVVAGEEVVAPPCVCHVARVGHGGVGTCGGGGGTCAAHDAAVAVLAMLAANDPFVSLLFFFLHNRASR